MVAATGCDAVMIGRTAPANPWIFRQIEQCCGNSKSPPCLAEDARQGWGTLRTDHVGAGALTRSVEHSSTNVRSAAYEVPSESDRYEMILTYFQMLIEEELPDATGKMKQFASWFTHGVAGGAALRKEIYDSKMAPDILARVENFFEARLAVQSPAVLIEG